MPSKSASNRRSPTAKSISTKKTVGYEPDEDEALEDALTYEHGFYRDEEEENERGYMERATSRVRAMTRDREGRVVVAALAGGFAVGVLIGGAIAAARAREESWSDRLACEGLGRRLLNRIGSVIPESITDRFGS
jgi:hypothetical protein